MPNQTEKTDAGRELEQAARIVPILAKLRDRLCSAGVSNDACVTALMNAAIGAALEQNAADIVAAFLRAHADNIERESKFAGWHTH